MSEQSQTGSFLEGLLIGSAVGAFLGILLAPAKGEEARSKLQETFLGLKDQCEHIKENLESDPEVLIQKTVESIEKGLSELGQMVQEIKDASEKRRKEVEALC